MADGTAKKKNPAKWAAAKTRAKAKMGGKHSARAMQLATKYYKDSGGSYEGKKPTSKTNKLKKWGKEKWQTKDGAGDKAKQSDGSTKRYLPKKAWSKLTPKQKAATDTKKRAASKRGQKVTPNTKAAKSAGKTARNSK
tara:strand:- start:1530 stop:1943 length:414 start_codon:yes stop_codon:yes gene_type:complete